MPFILPSISMHDGFEDTLKAIRTDMDRTDDDIPSTEPEIKSESESNSEVVCNVPTEPKTKKAFPNDTKQRKLFNNLENLTNAVLTGEQTSLLITGDSGVGKSYIVKSVAEDKFNTDGIETIKGFTTTKAMYNTLADAEMSNKSVVIFDDCDSVFKTTDSSNLIKGILDTDKVRKVNYGTQNSFDPTGMSKGEYKKLRDSGRSPSYINFTKKVIFISNLPTTKIEKAILSRTMNIDISLTHAEVIERLRDVMEYIEPETSMDVKNDVLNYIESCSEVSLNMHSFVKAIRIANTTTDWKSIMRYL